MTWFANPGWRGSPNRAALDGAAAPAYTGPLDIASTGAFGWWGFRASNAAYISGTKHLVDLLDASGSNPITIDCTATGVFDSSAYNTWATAHSVTAGTALVTKLYDQVSTNHFTQGTSANMPTFNNTGVFSMSLANSFGGKYLNTGNIVLSQPWSLSSVANRVNSSGGNEQFLENGATGNGFGVNSTLNAGLIGIGTLASSNAVTLNTPFAVQSLMNGAAPNSAVYLDGTNTTGASGTAGFATEPLYVIGSAGGASDVIKFTEAGLWSGDQSSHFSALNTNQHTFWGF